MSSLFVIQGRDQGKRFELESSVVGIGRDALNGVRLHDTEVSRRHAEVRQSAEGTLWVDLQSANGSFINSVRVDAQVLSSGDRIQVGRTLMIFTDSTDTPEAVTHQEVDIIGKAGDPPPSRIVSSLGHEAGSQFLSGVDAQSDSPWLKHARRHLHVMYHTALAVSHTLDIDQLLQRIMELIFEWLDVDRVCIMLKDDETGELEPKVRRDRKRSAESALDSSAEKSNAMRISRTILDYVCTRQEGVLTSDARDDSRWEAGASIMKQGVREAICIPMQGRYGIVGVIYVDTYTPPGRLLQDGILQAARGTMTSGANQFHDEHLKLLIAIGHQAALAIEDTSYYSAMVQAERLAAMGQAIASVSHHVKNILQGIRGGSYLVESGLKQQNWEITKRGWNIVDKNQDRISRLVMDMLTFSKDREPEVMACDLNEVVGDVLDLMRGRASASSVELVDARGTAIPHMTFDPEGIHRAVLNVVANAIDACIEQHEQRPEPSSDSTDDASDADNLGVAMDPANDADETDLQPDASEAVPILPAQQDVTGRKTTIMTNDALAMRVEVGTAYRHTEGMLVVEVTDTGGGIRPDHQRKIFNVFVSSKGRHGTGLGLPVSQKIVREHGGEIVVESEPGVGSRFVLKWPAVQPDSQPASEDV